jgi:hypothetical protein
MNIIELVRDILQNYPQIQAVCNDVHIDFTEETPTSYGLAPTGDRLIKEDVLGNQIRQHNFILYAVYQSQSDYDRLANSGTILDLQLYLESKVQGQEITVIVGEEELTGELLKLTCANGMLYSIPEDNLNSGVLYQLQITADYKIDI